MSKNGIFIAITCLMAGVTSIAAAIMSPSGWAAALLCPVGTLCLVASATIATAMIRERDQR